MPIGPSADVPADLGDVQADAAAAFASAIGEGATPTDAPAGGDTPAPSQDAGTPSSPPPSPAEGAPQAGQAAAPSTQTPTIDPSTWTAEARRALEMEGWDGKSQVSPELLAKVAARYLEFNNRNAELAKQVKSQPTETKPGEPAPASPAAEPPKPPEPPVAAEPEVTPDQVAKTVEAQIDADPECVRMVNEFLSLDAELKTLVNGDGVKPGALLQVQEELKFHKRLLERPDIKDNPLAQEEEARLVASLETQFETLLARRERLEARRERLEDKYDRRTGQIRSTLEGELAQRAATTRRAQELTAKWPTFMDRALVANNVPAGLQAFIKKRVSDAFVLSVNRGEAVSDVEIFLQQATQKALSEYDEVYRLKQAEHGKLAQQRTEIVSPPSQTPSAQPHATATTTDGDDLSAIEDAAHQSLYREFTAAR